MHPRAAEFAARAEDEHGLEIAVEEFPDGTSSAADAAGAIGCDVSRIASSLVFRVPDPVVVVTSGANKTSEEKLAAVVGVAENEVGMASAEEIRETVGWSIGGVPPFCHDERVPVYLDETLREFEEVWAAAGTPNAVFAVAPETIQEIADAEVVDVAE